MDTELKRIYLVHNLHYDTALINRAEQWLKRKYGPILTNPVKRQYNKQRCVDYITNHHPIVIAMENDNGLLGRGCCNQLQLALKLKLQVFVLRKYGTKWRLVRIKRLVVVDKADWNNFVRINK